MFGGKGRVTQLISVVLGQTPKPLIGGYPNILATTKARNCTTPAAIVLSREANGKRLRWVNRRGVPTLNGSHQLADTALLLQRSRAPVQAEAQPARPKCARNSGDSTPLNARWPRGVLSAPDEGCGAIPHRFLTPVHVTPAGSTLKALFCRLTTRCDAITDVVRAAPRFE